MSNPANILDQFRSFNYHHILVACSNQRVVEELSSSRGNDIEVYNQLQSTQAIPLRDENGIEIPDTVGGKYFVVANNLRDAKLTIDKASWETVIAGSVNTTDMGNSIAVSGDMTITEPRGFTFLNTLNTVANQFQSDPVGIVYLLKTIFIGHPTNLGAFDGQQVIADVTPLRLSIMDVKATFGVLGGTYNIKFVGAANGMSRYPQISRGSENIRLQPSSRVLKDVLADLATAMTEKSAETYEEVRDAIRQKYQERGISSENADLLRRVEYEIVVDEGGRYDDESYVVSEFDPRLTTDGEPDSPAPLSWGKSYTVEQAIQDILKRTQKIQDDLNIADRDGRRYRYKIFSEVTMKDAPQVINAGDANTSNAETLVVRYTVRPFLELTTDVLQEILDGNASGTNVDNTAIQNSLIEFDYYFTGRNVDILKFDLKLNQGITFLQVLRSADNSMSAIEQQAGGTPSNDVLAVNGTSQRPTDEFLVRPRTPIFPTTDVKDVLSQNVGKPLSTTAFNAALSRHASLEQLQTEMSIRGNPYLLSTTNLPPSQKNDPDNADLEPDERRVLVNWDRVPSLMRVNIRMPENSNNPSGRDAPDLEPFWYDGYYYITRIKHRFAGGEFTQDLVAFSIQSDDALQNEGRSVASQPPQVNEDTQREELPENDTETEPFSTTQRQRQEFRTRGGAAARAKKNAEDSARATRAPILSGRRRRDNRGRQ